jgi:GT2 family glycosyltransferase
MPPATRFEHPARPRHVVTAVLVAHDGERWLPTTLNAVMTQRRPVQRFVAVDTGSVDDSRLLLERAVGAPSVLTAPRRFGFGAAVQLAVSAFEHAPDLASTRSDAGEPVEWLWLLHDDSAPSPTALEAMLELADDMPSAGVIGPKLRGWDNHRVLVEFGVTLDRGGRRETRLEPGELDHGQHDGDRDVLAVSSAGMLVRRDVWESLRGFDPAVPLFRDDVDFGWRANLAGHRVVACTRAVVYHAEAAAGGAREVAAGVGRVRRIDRQAAIRTLLVNSAPGWLVWKAVRLLLGTILRAVAFLLLRRPRDAWDEVTAAAGVYAHPRTLRRARLARRGQRAVPYGDVRRLLAPRGSRLRHYADAFSQWVATIGADADAQRAGRGDRGLLRRLLLRPGVGLVAVLLVVALVAERHVLTGTLYGGALLPAPRGATDLWHTYTQYWHPTGFGSTTDAPPYLAIVALVGFVLLGSARLAVQVLLLGSVPLAGLFAYAAAAPLARNTRLRLWLAATYALLPVATGAVASGRLGTAVAFAVLPLIVGALARALLPPLVLSPVLAGASTRGHSGGMSPAWAAAGVLAVGAAFDPLLYVLLAPLVLAAFGASVVRRSFLGVRRAFVVLAVPPLLLLPWTARVVAHPALLVTGVGLPQPGLQSPRLRPLDVLLLHPGGPGMPPVWLDAVIVLAGLAGLLQLTRPGPARLGSLFVLSGLVGGVLVSRAHVHTPAGAGAAVAVPGWPGTATAVIAIGLLMSAAVAGARMRARLATTSFGWRQPVAVVLTATAVATPFAAAGWWVASGTGDHLHAGAYDVLPPFVTDPSANPDQPRTIVLRPAASGTVTYAMLRAHPPQLGDADLPPAPAQVAAVSGAVADLVGGFGQRAATELAHAGVRYVLVPVAGDGGISARIAAAGGVVPKALSGDWRVWQVEAAAGRVMIATQGVDAWQVAANGGAIGAHTAPVEVPYSPLPRDLVITESPSPIWRAAVVGAAGGLQPLKPTVVDGMQAFVLPSAAAQVRVYRTPNRRADWLWGELIGVLVVIVATVPNRRRRPMPPPPQRTPDAAGRPAVAATVGGPA